MARRVKRYKTRRSVFVSDDSAAVPPSLSAYPPSVFFSSGCLLLAHTHARTLFFAQTRGETRPCACVRPPVPPPLWRIHKGYAAAHPFRYSVNRKCRGFKGICVRFVFVWFNDKKLYFFNGIRTRMQFAMISELFKYANVINEKKENALINVKQVTDDVTFRLH